MSELFIAESKRDGFAHDIDRENGKEEWLTPPEIIKAFGPFDLDPCAPVNRPWATAKNHFTIEDNGLIKPWDGFVFCNPPYGNKTGDWLKRCAEHNNCIVLIFARTETEAFHRWVWPHAKSIFFLKGRISFFHVTGKRGGGSRRAVRGCCLWRACRPRAARPGGFRWSLCKQSTGGRFWTERLHRLMTRAVYIQREDGDYDFAAAFAINEGRWDEDVAETFAENLRQEGEEVMVVQNCDLNKLPDVWEVAK